jgi:hypothetical protein
MAADPQDSYAEWKTSKVLSDLGQRLVTLSDMNKHALLSKVTGLIHGDESQARAAAILSRLHQLNAQVAQEFHPKLNALSDISLRMVCPTGNNPQSSAGHVSSYIAVSYCWHYKQWPLAPAAKPLFPGWEISEPMVKAVMDLRRPDEGVWIDKLCINQDDQADKAAHIGVMDAIYRSARRIAILLEDVQLSKDEENTGLVYRKFYEDLCQEVKEAGLEGAEKVAFIRAYFPYREQLLQDENKGHLLAAAKPFAMKLLSARWFSRGWCAHESRMAKHEKIDNPLFFCFGAEDQVLSFEFRFIHYLGTYLTKFEPEADLLSFPQINTMKESDLKTLQQLGWRAQRLLPDGRATVSAMQHLVSVLSFGCFKKGDLISIALNTAGIPLYFDGEDVQCVEEVIWRFTLLALAANDLVPLVATGPQLRLPSQEGDIISWAIHPNQPILDDHLGNPLPGSITAVTREYIEMDLLVFESLPKQASPESQAKATRLITQHNFDAIADGLFSALSDYAQATIRNGADAMVRIRPEARPLHTLRHLLLSLSLDNGLDWVLAFPSAMLQTSSSSSWMYGALGEHAHPSLTTAVHAFSALLTNSDNTSNTSDPNPDQPPSQSPALTPEQLETLHRALTTLLDPRMILFTPNPRRLPLSPRLGTATLTTSISNRSYIAIPAALAHLPGSYDRAWVVEPFDPSNARPWEEEVESYLAKPGQLRVAKDGEEGEEKREVVIPVSNSDYGDIREPRDDSRGTWRVRNRQVLFGCASGGLGLWGEEGREILQKGGEEVLKGGEGIVSLRRQKVYGCEDYPWGRMRAAVDEVMGVAEEGCGAVDAK